MRVTTRLMGSIIALGLLVPACDTADSGSELTVQDGSAQGSDAGGDTTVAPDTAVAMDTGITVDGTPDVPTLDIAQADTATTPDTTLDTSGTAADTGTADDVKTAHPPLCGALKAGLVTNFSVDGEPRAFMLSLPDGAEDGGPWPVVFNWHGYGDTAFNMNMLLLSEVDDPAFPFILVTPDDLNLQPPDGLDWDMLTVNDPNREARLFDEVLGCIDERYGVDPDRVYSVGFSAGAITSDMLGALRGDQLAAVVSFSGAYFSNPDTAALLGTLSGFVSWPEPVEASYAQLMSYGGPNDSFAMVVVTLQFDQAALGDAPYLTARGHDVVLCNHNQGHTIPAALMAPRIVEFLEAHPRGVPSPFMAGLPAGYPDYCEAMPAE